MHRCRSWGCSNLPPQNDFEKSLVPTPLPPHIPTLILSVLKYQGLSPHPIPQYWKKEQKNNSFYRSIHKFSDQVKQLGKQRGPRAACSGEHSDRGPYCLPFPARCISLQLDLIPIFLGTLRYLKHQNLNKKRRKKIFFQAFEFWYFFFLFEKCTKH